MVEAADNQKKLEEMQALQLNDIMRYELNEKEYDEMLPIARNSKDVNNMSFSEMLSESASNQDKLYEINALGLEADLGTIPDSWELSEGEVDKIAAYVSAKPRKVFPRDDD